MKYRYFLQFLLAMLAFGVLTCLTASADGDPGDACTDAPHVPPSDPANGCVTSGLVNSVTPSTVMPFTDACDANGMNCQAYGDLYNGVESFYGHFGNIETGESRVFWTGRCSRTCGRRNSRFRQ